MRGLLFEEASLLRDREREVKKSLATLGVCVDEMINDRGLPGSATVDVGEIEEVAASWSGIPVQRMTLDEADVLANMDDALEQAVIGQEEATSAVARALRRTVETRSRPSSARPQGCFQTQTTAGCRGEVGTSADCQTRRPSPPLCVRAAVRSDPPGRLLRKAEDVLFLKLTVRLTLSFRVLGPQCATRPTGTSRKGRQRRDCGDAMSSHRCWCVG